ncbi:hypothetical protein I8D39_000867 [Salmonella enterica]|uniref:Uncharacterized protein n=1 Tax=Salmonella enterica TaxID=28901 RepID=A0A402TN78_SALER|nr:hypothetical protein [Salmonella enterica]EAS1786367.1 hypothetical protein [Salmonella enterica]EAX1171951.1 hypothetical protein [Salmonella enterica]EAX3208653.1 hypothetical protein [Salmonella enterica]EBA1685109.1 hypothetical protein [Salmonella enterica]
MAKNENDEIKKFIFSQTVIYLSSVMADKSNRLPSRDGVQDLLSEKFHDVYDWLLDEYNQVAD